jgi:hypothetical protein
MRLKHRLAILASGLGTMTYGWMQLARHHWVYKGGYFLTLYSPGVIATGVFICLLAFIPSGAGSDRLVLGKGRRRKHPPG